MNQPLSYTARYAAQPLNAKIYETYLTTLQLDLNDRSRLLARGLTLDHIARAQYASKGAATKATSNALGTVERAYNLDGVAGFYWDEKRNQRAVFGKQGLLIPSRDVDGQISSLLLRDNAAAHGKPKYIAFSTGNKPRGGRTYNTTHCPIIGGSPSEQSGAIIRVTEGILKADVTTALGDIYCIGLHGINAPDNLAYTLERLQCSKVLLCLDQEQTKDVIRARAKLYAEIKELGYDVNFETWDPNYKGIDDALLKAKDSVRELSTDELASYIEDGRELDPKNGEWVYVIGIERMVHVEHATELKKAQFADKFGMGTADAVSDLLTGEFRRVDSPVYVPGAPRFIKERGQEYLNFWVPREITSAAGNVEPFIEHLSYLFPVDEERQTIEQYIAHHIQSPGDKIHWAPIVCGLPGTGKSFLGEVVEKMLGEKNVSRPSNESIHEIYNGWMKRAQIVVVQELMSDGRRELMNKLKPMITDPIVSVREMHKQSYEMPNHCNFMFFTNHKDAIIIEENDRRWFVVHSPAIPKAPEEYVKLFSWLHEEQTAPALMHWAENVDMTGFLPKAHAPKTGARAELVKMSMTPLAAWISSGIEENAWPFNLDLISIRHLKSRSVCPPEFSRLSDHKFGDALRAAGAMKLPGAPYTLPDQSKATIWALRRAELYGQLDKEAVVEKYMKWANSQAQPGGNPLEETSPF